LVKEMPTVKRLKFVQSYVSRGHAYHYFRKPGVRIPLPGPFMSEGFRTAYAAALGGGHTAAIEPGANRTKPGSVTALIAAYVGTSEFKNLAQETRRQRWSIMRGLQNDAGGNPVRLLTKEHLYRKLSTLTPFMHRNWDRALKPLFAYAVETGMTKVNPFDGIKKPKLPKTNGFRAWTESEVERFRAFWKLGTMERLAIEILINTIMRGGDVIRLGPQHIHKEKGRIMDFKTKKTGARLTLPVLPELAEAIRATPSGQLTFLTAGNGQPFNAGAWGKWFAAACDAAGLGKAFRAHGLRKAGMIRLARAGCPLYEIAAWSGHTKWQQIEVYIREAQQELLAANAIERLNGAKNAGRGSLTSMQRRVPS
jgi:integrase